MSYRDIVNVQMGRCFIEVHDRIEYMKIRISFLKAFHIFTQTSHSYFGIGSADTCIIFCADLNQIFIETFLLICTCDYRLAWLTIKQVLKIVQNFTVTSFLTGIVSLYCITEKPMISFTQVLLNKSDVIRSPEQVNIFGSELPIIM